jgi:hypothetical protein
LRDLGAPLDRWIGRRLSDSTRWHMVAAGWGVAIGVSVLTALIPFLL